MGCGDISSPSPAFRDTIDQIDPALTVGPFGLGFHPWVAVDHCIWIELFDAFVTQPMIAMGMGGKDGHFLVIQLLRQDEPGGQAGIAGLTVTGIAEIIKDEEMVLCFHGPSAVTKKPSELKAGSKDAKRRKSFCSRMSGMKRRLTSAKTARDPDSRINKALRRWNCN